MATETITNTITTEQGSLPDQSEPWQATSMLLAAINRELSVVVRTEPLPQVEMATATLSPLPVTSTEVFPPQTLQNQLGRMDFNSLTEGIQRGDPMAQNRFVEALYDDVLHYISSKGTPDSEDLTQDIMMHALLKIQGGRFDPSKGSLKGWLLKVAHNKWATHAKQSSNIYSRETDDEGIDQAHKSGSSYDPEKIIISKQTSQEVRAALQYIPAKWRDVIVLSFYHNLTYAEIASRLGISVGTVKSRVFHSKKMLRPYLKDLRAA